MSYAVNSNLFTAGDIQSMMVSISADGRYTAYLDNIGDVYLQSYDYVIKIVDNNTGVIRSLASVPDPALQYPQMTYPVLSGDGQSLLFYLSSKLANDSKLMHLDLPTNQLRAVVSTTSDGSASDRSYSPSISADGRYVAFASSAANLVDGDSNGVSDIFVKDMLTGSLRRVSTDGSGKQLAAPSGAPILSSDGSAVLFKIDGPAAGDAAGAYVKRLDTGTLLLANAASNGAVVKDGAGLDLSANGRYVLFSAPSAASAAPGSAVFRRDMQTGETVRVTAPDQHKVARAEMSDDGRHVLFLDKAASARPHVGLVGELKMRDMETGAVNTVSDEAGKGWGVIQFSLSGDGAHVSYTNSMDSSWFKSPTPQMLVTSSIVPDVPASAAPTGLVPQRWLPQQGNQIVDGGAGLDTVLYRGNMADYALAFGGGIVAVSDRVDGRDGADILANVERMRFADGALALDTAGHAGQAYRLYQAAFDRPADKAGLGFWIDCLDSGHSLAAVADGFMRTREFKALYGDAGNAQLVDRLYMNVLHRPGDASGVAYWTDVLDRQLADAPQVLAAFAESPENVAALIGVMDKGIAYTHYLAY